ncbi:hypothetical protein AD05_5101 [Escherichia coli 5-366-08_S4_C2]|nr:hypothetical protein AD05_5101 [Escherichia coli 5-366-08_S4_C2]
MVISLLFAFQPSLSNTLKINREFPRDKKWVNAYYFCT